MAWGKVVTLTATVKTAGAAVPQGQVNFCDTAATYCTDIHLVGVADLTTSGTATFTFVPSPGVHSYKAEYAGTSGLTGPSLTSATVYAASASAVASLTVDSVPTTTAITQSGSAGAYTLKATVAGTGSDTGPTGTVSFLDTSNSNAVLGSATLGTAAQALSWTTPQSPVTASQPNSIAVADFNGDGIPDLAIATNGISGGNGSIQILLGNGDGTFQAAKTYAGLPGIQFIVAAPFITGGPEDLLAVNNANTGTYLFEDNGLLFTGDGKGNFQAGTPFENCLNSVSAIVVGDFNGDGIPDFAVAGVLNGAPVNGVLYPLPNVAFTFGDGTGNFPITGYGCSSSDLYGIFSSVVATTALGVGDFKGDGAQDIAAVQSNGEVNIFLRDPASAYPAMGGPTQITQTAGSSSTAIAVGDFNGDGYADLAITNGGQNNVTILLGDGTGINFTAAASPSTGSTPTAIAVGDFNGDGIDDLAVANSGDGTVTILLGNGDGTFTAQPALNAGSTSVALAVGTFNGSGTADVAVVNQAAPGSLTGPTATILLSQLIQTVTATASGISVTGAGAHLVEASYPGDASYAASLSGTTSLSAQSPSTTLTLTANPASSTLGQQVVLTATLSPYSAGANSTNGETVTFSNGSGSIGTGTLSSGVATLNTTSLPAGTDSLTAKFAGDANFNASTSAAVAFTVSSAGVSLSSNTLTFASQLTGTTSTAQIITLTDSGQGALSITSISASAPFAETNTCGSSVASGANCTISVTFAPTAAGSPTGTLTISDNASNSPQTVLLSGTAISPTPVVSLSAANLTFAAQETGSASTAQTVTVSNTGTGALAISSIAASANFGETNTCGSSLAAGANCLVSVTFTPTAGGSLTGTLTITDNASTSPQTVALTGTGTSVGVTITSSSLTIPSAGGLATATIEISSAGGFSGTVNLTCAVTYQGSGTAKDLPTCNLNPQQGQVSANSPLFSMLTVSTTGTTASAMSNGAWLPSGAALAALFFVGFLPRRRWKSAIFLVLLAIAVVCSATGCGGSAAANKGTTAGSYQVVVTASSATVTASTAISLTLQ